MRARSEVALLAAVVLIAAAFALLAPGTARAAEIYVVDIATDANPGGGGQSTGALSGDLRWCMTQANSTPGEYDRIDFTIAGAGPHTISPVALLPDITDGVFINGYSQPGSFPPGPGTVPATILIVINGAGAGAGDGLHVSPGSNGTTISGLSIINFGDDGIHLENVGGCQVHANHIGVDAAGTGDGGNTFMGVHVTDGSASNTIGGAAASDRNVISGNSADGVRVSGSTDNTISANYIGLASDGTTAIMNNGNGVYLTTAATGNTVGGSTSGRRNIISGNNNCGVNMFIASSNTVAGNYIGTDVDGDEDEGNAQSGVMVRNGSNNVTVGGAAAGEGNVISGNESDGVHIEDSIGVTVSGNLIGTDSTGTQDRGNTGEGVHLLNPGATGNTVGGTTAAERNVISGNNGGGVYIDAGDGNTVEGNFIGTDQTGTAAVPNWRGVAIDNGGAANTVGGATMAERNIISGNNDNGVYLGICSNSVISGNYIGLDVGGANALGNNSEGVKVAAGAADVTIGGDAAGTGNVISSNGRSGIDIGGGGSGIDIKGNYIGLDASGTMDRGNSMDGVRVVSWADVVIGGGAAAQRNVISDNGMNGVSLNTAATTTIQGNYIGTDAAGAADMGNAGCGVSVSSSDGTVVGGASAGNKINHNTMQGVYMNMSADCQVVENQIRENGAAGVTVEWASALRNRLSRNSIYRNGSPGIELLNGGNADYASPVFSSGSFELVGGSVSVSGTAPASSSVEFYSTGAETDPSGSGQGMTYLATTTASAGGSFSASLTGLTFDEHISAIAISPASHPSGEGNTSEFATNALVVHPAPTVTSVTPSAAAAGTTVSIPNLAGTGFWGTPSVQLIGPAAGAGQAGKGTITATNVTVVSSTKITCRFDLAGATEGLYSVKVTNNDGKSATKANAFTVESSRHTWYLAEGTTAWGFSTYISVQNPGASAVTVDVTYNTSEGPVAGPTVDMPARSQATVNPADTLGEKDFSTLVECTDHTRSIAVDRTMSWTGGAGASGKGSGQEAHCSVGVTSPAKTWYLPEGSTDWGFECYLLIQNPGTTVANCTITYMIEGADPVDVPVQVPASGRGTWNMAEHIGSEDASIKVVSDVPVIPERAMYRNSRREGHDSIGTTTPATDYYLAEGACGYDVGYITYVLVQNPQESATDVAISYLTGSGQVPGPSFTMSANSRKTVRLNDQLPPNTDVSTSVHGSQPIIAERAMYWNNGTGEACHDSIGMDSPHACFYLPDGQTDEGRETWTLVQNPNDTDVQVTITYMTPQGTGNVEKTETVPANSRRTFNMAEHSGLSGRASIMVESASSPIMVERAMYWNSRGAGTDTIGGYADL
ncbi:MAG: right-handed parallel beta-helix repeat-containing protein [Actinobacteria bacterium]|nr:right-handed parallel beta-helix repeat-containing protein [Actinomycetota bacterium]MBU1945029.1 right-handed parallel beta-helix repeat-containing protein [Actinomycetota bacterium]MBU2686635.1 right-handed parallel beta-helix repeat-containing protein [Actinomycetota bacterium]